MENDFFDFTTSDQEIISSVEDISVQLWQQSRRYAKPFEEEEEAKIK